MAYNGKRRGEAKVRVVVRNDITFPHRAFTHAVGAAPLQKSSILGPHLAFSTLSIASERLQDRVQWHVLEQILRNAK